MKKLNALLSPEIIEWCIWLVSFFGLLFVFNTKTYLAFLFVAGFVLYQLVKKLDITLFYPLLLCLPFERLIRDVLLVVVPASPNDWEPGYAYYFGISIKLLITWGTLLLLLLQKKLGLDLFERKKHWYLWLPILFILLSGISTYFAPRFDLAITGIIRLGTTIGIFYLSYYFLQKGSLKKHLYKYFLSLLLFLGFVGTQQTILQRPLGLFMEEIAQWSRNGITTTDGDLLQRASGLMNHPTYFGAFLTMLIPVAIGILINFIQKKNIFKLKPAFLLNLGALVLGITALIGTLSRSAWIAFMLVVLIFMIKFRQNLFNQLSKSRLPLFITMLSIIIVGLLFAPFIQSRIYSLLDVWGVGNGKGRLALMQQSITMIGNHPLLGAGINHFTGEMMNQGVAEKDRGFIYPVHNTFLLFFSELGIPAGVIFILFIGTILVLTWKKTQRNLRDFGIWLGVFTFIVSAQFQTLFSQDPSMDILMVMLAYLTLL